MALTECGWLFYIDLMVAWRHVKEVNHNWIVVRIQNAAIVDVTFNSIADSPYGCIDLPWYCEKVYTCINSLHQFSLILYMHNALLNSSNNITTRQLLAWDVIYTSCAYAMMSVSVCLSVTFVHWGHRVQWIPDTLPCLDRWMSLLMTDNASPRSSYGMMPGFLVEERRGHLALC